MTSAPFQPERRLCFLFLLYHLSLLQTLLSICQSSSHLANIAPVNPNIYPSSCKLHVFAVVPCTPHMPSPSIIYTSICSPLRLWQTPLKQNDAQTLTFSLCLSLILRAITHPSLSHLFTSSRAAVRCKHRSWGVSISHGGGFVLVTNRLMICCYVFQNKQVELGFHYSKESNQKFSYLKFSGFKLHHSGLTGSVHRLYN